MQEIRCPAVGHRGLELGVSIDGGTPKWIVYKGKNPIKMYDSGVPLF